uniref:Methyltransferase-like protein 27 n=1 Tax=Dermatophagoides pteronyssinus TaxID=6956 RepID=A0A6P6XUU2_DERPT|nr:methyltransferase-like protein 27 [Dermatophagoides pteronyssinus]
MNENNVNQTISLTKNLDCEKSVDQLLDQLVKPKNHQETDDFYSIWASNYEKDIKEMDYNGGHIAAKYFLQMNFNKNDKILDIGAGTGIIGEILNKNGYHNLDALDNNDEMLKILKEKNCYQNIIKSIVTPDQKLPINDQQYDVIIMAGIFCPGHIDYRSLEQIIRITKSGGFICWSMGNPKIYADRDQLYSDDNFDRYISLLCDKMKWLSVLGYPIIVENYIKNLSGLFYAMQVV